MASDKALYDLCDRSSAIALMRALVMTSVVLRRIRNRLRIIIIIIINESACVNANVEVLGSVGLVD